MAKPNKAVVVFSGGQDSTTCLFWAKKKYDEVIALSFNYGQRHSKELECAKKICKEHGVEHHILDMGLLNQLAPNSLTRVDMEVDHRWKKYVILNICSCFCKTKRYSCVSNGCFPE